MPDYEIAEFIPQASQSYTVPITNLRRASLDKAIVRAQKEMDKINGGREYRLVVVLNDKRKVVAGPCNACAKVCPSGPEFLGPDGYDICEECRLAIERRGLTDE